MTNSISDFLLPSLRPQSTTQQAEERFGTFIGVFVPSILMLFGVILFLRIGWILGHAGLPATLVIMTLAAVIILISVASMASIATNIEIGGGGFYYIISRSLGLEVGCAIGIPLYVKQSLTVSFCTIGFAESLHDLMPSWSITSIGIITLSLLTLCAYTSLRNTLFIQIAIFIILITSFISLFTGGNLIPPADNIFTPSPPHSLGFWSIFALYFPAMTGLESSVSLSGNLRNPSRSLPIGTVSAVLVAYGTYVAVALFLFYHVPLFRLAEDPLILQDLAQIPSLIIVGIWGATLSSAIGGLLGAPRTLQAISEDGIGPRIFGKTFGPNKEPRIATISTFILALGGIYFGSINVIAPLLTMISLICYGVLNLSASLETLMANPSWRPSFPVHWTIGLLGTLLCLVAMLMIDAGTAIVSLGFIAVIYWIAKQRNLDASWEDIRNGILIFFIRFATYRLASSSCLSKSWRPHFLVFTEKPEPSNNLIRFSQSISQGKGFLTTASFLPSNRISENERRNQEQKLTQKLHKERIDSFVQLIPSVKPTQDMLEMIKFFGIGPLTPDTVVFEGLFTQSEDYEFAKLIYEANKRHCNVVILNETGSSLTTQSNPAFSRPLGDIHVWWDDAHPANSNLMLVLAYMLQKSPAWKKSRICLNGCVSNEHIRKEKLRQFRNLSLERRLPLYTEIFVAPEQSSNKLDLIKEFSKDAGIVFISLRPLQDGESLESYKNYLQTLPHAATDFPSTAQVLSSEYTPLEEVLK